MKKKLFVLLLPLGGALMALPLIFPRIGLLEWVVMVPALLYLFGHAERTQTRLRRYYALGLLYYFSFFFVVFHWFLRLYPMEFAGVTKGEAALLVAICWVGLSLLQTVIAAFSFPLFVWLARSAPVRRVGVLTPFLFAAVYTVFEWGQTLTWMGVPWARLPLGQAACGILWNSATLFGSYFLTFALVAVNGLIAYTVLHFDRVRVTAIACVAVFLLNLGAGAIGALTAQHGDGAHFIVAAVQGNVGSSQKWTSDSTQKSFQVYEKYTAEAVEAGAEIVVFPETFVPLHFYEGSVLYRFVVQLATTYRVTVLCGGFAFDEQGNSKNAIFAVSPDGSVCETVYVKRHLVPFGEYVPMRTLVEFLIPPLADIGMLSDDLIPGEESAVMELVQGKVGALICFDSIYEVLTLASVRDGAQILSLSTNDSWFLDSAAADMHLRQAQLRAIESGRYVIRSADTGISAIIEPDGDTKEVIPALEEGVSISTVAPRAARTLYSYIGNLWVYLLLAALSLLSVQRIVAWVRTKRRAPRAIEA